MYGSEVMSPAWRNVMPRGPDQVRREPGDEEDLRGVAAELAERGAEDLPLPQQRPDVAPSEADGLALVFAAAARLDVVDLGLVGAAVAGIAIERPPDEPEGHAEGAHDDEQPAPSVPLRDPEEGHAQEAEADVLPNE
jgi:hypothetical protein